LMNGITIGIHADKRTRWGILLISASAILLPFGLELLGVVPPAYAFDEGRLLILPRLAHLPPGVTLLTLTISSVAVATLPVLFFGGVRDALFEARRQLFHQAWHLRQLVPERVQQSLEEPSQATADPPSQ